MKKENDSFRSHQQMMHEYGYSFDGDEVMRAHARYHGQAPSEGCMNFYETVALYAAMAYQRGIEGGKLSDLFPFIKESAPAATETQSKKPKPSHNCNYSITAGAALSNERSST